MGLVLGSTTDGISRRRALMIAPFALGGAAAVLSQVGRSSGGSEQDVGIIDFDAAGRKLGPAVRKKEVRSDGDWREIVRNVVES
ncbi:MAG TPA: hypothetical protein VL127_02155 [Bryobacteraceae bacterium]|nr:hypothetical protein [Bryobacteraceae bacterium]